MTFFLGVRTGPGKRNPEICDEKRARRTEMTIVGLDDTDSRDRGMCTTYAAARIAKRIEAAGGEIHDRLLIRLNPAVEHKTRGNAALAVHTDLDATEVLEIGRDEIDDAAETRDRNTNPGLVVAPGSIDEIPPAVVDFARHAVRHHHDLADAEALIEDVGYRFASWKNARGLIGALAAVGADAPFEDWTYEHIAYRPRTRWGTPRAVDRESVFQAADGGYPEAWDTVDRVEGQAVCVPNAPGPILYGIRGDDPEVVQAVADGIESEPIETTALFRTNQGTDAHLIDATVPEVEDGQSYRVDGTVVDAPETRHGGHVFLRIADHGQSLRCAAFEPTKRFRDRVRSLREGDRLTVCGEVSDGTLKLEKFAVRELERTESVVPECPDCERSMESAGRDQGYRCRDCGTDAPGKIERRVNRDIERGWYEVPPCARRHIAKPLIRGFFDAPTHPER
ncbi:MAG: tRNA(Ile2)-agmatinylcytidine synthase [Halobacteriales archaeon]|jgi:tRNA(Ile2)-agmatinylcytidine synthase